MKIEVQWITEVSKHVACLTENYRCDKNDSKNLLMFTFLASGNLLVYTGY
ncbi:hypothetical protein WN55_06992 [Dufourea novaeangliae]|uniref:Uncharacterized protein n=1 Tax=Dufourea novaeangliae TaxID=178035 RepID=A0A154P0Q2_DUFNO|nr:hypothetical protein WN55_06992 [Dufourea novaeangliae]